MNNHFVGTASWSIPSQFKSLFHGEGSQLERYAKVFNCVEINSSFYRDHKPETYKKWSQMVGKDFRFSVKLSRHFTQHQRLKETGPKLKEVLDGIFELGDKLGVLLVQLPPSLNFEPKVAERFIGDLRKTYSGVIAWEPRHLSWIDEPALSLFEAYNINKVLADPDPVFLAQEKRSESVRYFRLHGTPEIYKSNYSKKRLQALAKEINAFSKPAWCIFDNTTFGYATKNGIQLKSLLT